MNSDFPAKMALATQAAVFGAVGLTATLTHFLVASALFSLAAIPIFYANVVGFALAFLVSYLGHYHLSFRSTAPAISALSRFLAVALIGFALNNLVLFVLHAGLGFHELVALAGAIVVSAGFVFILSKLWAFA